MLLSGQNLKEKTWGGNTKSKTFLSQSTSAFAKATARQAEDAEKGGLESQKLFLTESPEHTERSGFNYKVKICLSPFDKLMTGRAHGERRLENYSR